MALGVALTSLVAGCSTSAEYIGTTSQGVFFKVPNTWRVFDKATLQRLGLAVNAAANRHAAASGSSYTVYTGLAGASRRLLTKTSLNLYGAVPWALANAVSFGPSDQASMSLAGLQDLLFPLSQWQQGGLTVQQIGSTAVIVQGALRGAAPLSRPRRRAARWPSSRWPLSIAPPTRPGTWRWAAPCPASRPTAGS